MILCLCFRQQGIEMIKKLNKKRVLIVLYYYHPYVSGVSVYAKQVAEGLQSSGYEVTILTSQFDKNLPVHELVDGIKVIRRPVLFRLGKGVIMPFFWLDVVSYARASDFVNVHLPLADTGLSSLFIPRNKMITTYHCDINLGFTLIEKLVTAVSMLLMKVQLWRSAVVVPTTIDYFDSSKMKSFSAKAVPILPPIDETRFTPTPSTQLFDSLHIKKTDVVVGFLGRIVYEKGINYLLKSIDYLKKEFDSIKIVIVGDYENIAGGGVKEELDNYVRLYPDVITFTGFLEDPQRNEFYSGIDVFVLPSIDPLEAFGMVQVEAMLCGAPVVATDMPGVRQVILQTGYGRICRVKDAEDLAKNIAIVVKNPEKYKPDRKEVAKKFGLKNSIHDYEKLLT